MTFRVNQRVVCIDDNWTGDDEVQGLAPNRPKLKGIYTIRAIRDFYGMATGLLLKEMTNARDCLGVEIHFNSVHFRPLIERKTDISIFQQILDDASKRREAVS